VIAFLDASALIYLVEGAEPFASRVRSSLSRLLQKNTETVTAVSRLSWMECRVRPSRNGEVAVLASFDAFFARPDLLWVELDKDVVELATAIRITHGLRAADALQAASCLQFGLGHVFLTGDTGFRKVRGLNTKLLA
jgi:predicted nucleic acid-binding protein